MLFFAHYEVFKNDNLFGKSSIVCIMDCNTPLDKIIPIIQEKIQLDIVSKFPKISNELQSVIISISKLG